MVNLYIQLTSVIKTNIEQTLILLVLVKLSGRIEIYNLVVLNETLG